MGFERFWSRRTRVVLRVPAKASCFSSISRLFAVLCEHFQPSNRFPAFDISPSSSSSPLFLLLTPHASQSMLNPLGSTRNRHSAEEEDIACPSPFPSSDSHRLSSVQGGGEGGLTLDEPHADRLQVMGAREGAIKVRLNLPAGPSSCETEELHRVVEEGRLRDEVVC